MKKDSYAVSDYSQNLKLLMSQLKISNAQLAKGLHVDPSLVSRWLKKGAASAKQPITPSQLKNTSCANACRLKIGRG